MTFNVEQNRDTYFPLPLYYKQYIFLQLWLFGPSKHDNLTMLAFLESVYGSVSILAFPPTILTLKFSLLIRGPI